MFASLVGTLAVLEPADQALVAGFIINKFRGDVTLLKPGLDSSRSSPAGRCSACCRSPTDIGVDAEDGIDWALLQAGGPPLGDDVLRVTVVALPRMSNHTDADALACEPGVIVRFARQAAELADADLIVLPGSRATVRDLGWLRERGIDAAITRHVARGLPVLGICGGYQMLGTVIDDEVESGAGRVPGLGLLPVRTAFGPGKVVLLGATEEEGNYDARPTLAGVDRLERGSPRGRAGGRRVRRRRRVGGFTTGRARSPPDRRLGAAASTD